MYISTGGRSMIEDLCGDFPSGTLVGRDRTESGQKNSCGNNTRAEALKQLEYYSFSVIRSPFLGN